MVNAVTILEGDCRETLKTLPNCSVHCCVTSPPYFGLRDYGHGDQIGLETTPSDFVQQMVKVFREVKRVLRDDGTLWLNLGDSYARTGGTDRKVSKSAKVGSTRNTLQQIADRNQTAPDGLKPKDIIGIPWRVALALQADGWYLRQDIIWHKPNPMPESVRDRCTKAHEYIFLLSKNERYHFDYKAIQEPAVCGSNGSEFHTGKTGQHQLGRSSRKPRGCGNTQKRFGNNETTDRSQGEGLVETQRGIPWQGETRNKRSVWTVTTKPYKGAHFATFPRDLIEPCILAGTSEAGCCPHCGTAWKRIIEKERVPTRPGNQTKIGRVSDDEGSPYEQHSRMIVGNRNPQRHITTTKTVGWEAGCKCSHTINETDKCVVLDPFGGSGTTGQVARDLGCKAILCELNPEYVKLIKKRLGQDSLLV